MKDPYIIFKLVEKKPKTEIYIVLNIKSGIPLGIIKWYGAWRQYCFYPDKLTVFSHDCLGLIIEFINKLMEERKKR